MANDDSSGGIRKFCPTRWTVRGGAIQSILENCDVLNQLWEECLEERLEPDIKGRIIGVRAQMSQYNLLFGLKLCERILCITDNLSKTLQKQSLSAAEAQDVAKLNNETLKSFITDEAFELFYQLVERLSVNVGADGPTLPRKRKAPKRYEIGEGEGYHSPTVSEHYHRLYFEAIDLVTAGIKNRFDQPGYAIYQNLEALLLKAANKEDYSSELTEVITFFGSDIDESELTSQLLIFTIKFAAENQASKKITLIEILSFLQSLSEGQRTFYSQVCTVAHLLLVLPSTNAVSERSFSSMRRLKSYLRSTMGQARLNHLMLLSIYKDLLDGLDLKMTANEFVRESEHRQLVFGEFT